MSMVCLMLETHEAARAEFRAWFSAGSSIPAKMAMIAITTRSSIKVKFQNFPVEKRFPCFVIVTPPVSG